MLQTIDHSRQKIKPRYFLAKPDKTVVCILDAFADNFNPRLGSTAELNLSVSQTREINHEKVDNPSFSLIKDLYLIKLVLGTYEHWFQINSITKSMTNDQDTKNVTAFSLEHELTRRQIRDYKAASITPTLALTDALADTNWSIGHVSDSFLTKYRQFEISGTVTILEFVNRVAEGYQGLLKFDTVNRTVSLYELEELQQNFGLRFSLGNLLIGVQETADSSAMCTRLKLFGQNGLSINSVNASGTNYLENFGYFMDESYMSSGLISAIQNYNTLMASKQGNYTSLLANKTSLQESLTTEQNTYDSLKTEWQIITDNLYVAQQTGASTTTLLAQQASKKAELDAQQLIIDGINSDIADVDSQITSLQNEIAIENNFTPEQIIERNRFIIEKEWVNENFFDAQDLYDQGVIEFAKLIEPSLTITIEAINLLEILEEQPKWNLMLPQSILGSIVTIYHPKLNINIRAVVSEVNYNFSDGTISLTITNAKEILNSKEKYLKELQKSVSTSTTVTSNAPNWNAALRAGNGIIADNNNMIVEINTSEESGVVVKSADGRTQLLDKGLSVFSVSGVHELVKVGDVSETQNGTVYGIIGRDISGNELFRLDCATGLTISQDEGRVKLTGKGLVVFDIDKVTVKLRVGDISEAQDGSEYGLKIYNANGDVVVSNSGISNSDTIQLCDNVDATHRLKLKVFIPNDILEVRSAKLNFSLEKFRAYETSTSSGGASTQTSSSGGGGTTTSGASSTTSSAGGGGGTQTSSDDVRFSMNLATTVPQSQPVSFETHNHGVTVPQITHHHDVTYDPHTHDISHNHSVTYSPHSHSVNLPDHTHPLSFGIYESNMATGVNIYVDGNLVDSSGYTTDQDNIELKQHLQSSGWHSIELSSSSLGRINAALYYKAYTST